MRQLYITAAEAVTPVGLTAATTAAAVRAGISRLRRDELYLDAQGHPLSVCSLPDVEGFLDPIDRMRPAALAGLRRLLAGLDPRHDGGRPCHLLLGAPCEGREGPIYTEPRDTLPAALARELPPWLGALRVEVLHQGSPSALFGLERAAELLDRDPRALCIVGAVDSLLDEDLLERLEEEERLRLEEHGPHGLSPGEAAGFVVVEAAGGASPRGPLAVVEGWAVGFEPHPFVSEEASFGEGLADVCRRALALARVRGDELEAVLIDLDGEHHRAKEWALVESRCLGPRDELRALVHPAEGYGTIGAASAAVLLAIVAASRGWLDGLSLVLGSDDEGPRGAAVLRRHWRGA